MAESNDGPVVDAHAHIFTRAMPFAPGAHARPDYEYPVEAWLADLDAHGVSYGVVAAASLWDDHNDYMLAVLRAHPDRLRGTVILAPETPPETIRTLASRGVVGVRLVWRRLSSFPDLTAEPWRTFLCHLADHGLHVELLAGGADLPGLLPPLLDAGVRIVIDHLGAPPSEPGPRATGMDALLRAVESGRVWVKLSAGFRVPPAIAAQCAAQLLADAGPERLLWGSDAPFVSHESSMDYAGALALYRRLVPDAATRRAIDETALALFFT